MLVDTQTRAGVYGEPNYVSTEDAFGYETWENLGGFGMHKNKCDPTRLIERKEYFKDVLDCTSQCPGDNINDAGLDVPDNPPNQTSAYCLENCGW